MREQPLITLPELRKQIDDIQRRLTNGCGDGGCQIKQPTGMHTNGGCRCDPSSFAEELFYIGMELERYRRRRWAAEEMNICIGNGDPGSGCGSVAARSGYACPKCGGMVLSQSSLDAAAKSHE